MKAEAMAASCFIDGGDLPCALDLYCFYTKAAGGNTFRGL